MSDGKIVPNDLEMENLRAFGEMYFSKAVDIVFNPTKPLDTEDVEIMHKSLNFLVQMYINRVKSGEFNNYTIH